MLRIVIPPIHDQLAPHPQCCAVQTRFVVGRGITVHKCHADQGHLIRVHPVVHKHLVQGSPHRG